MLRQCGVARVRRSIAWCSCWTTPNWLACWARRLGFRSASERSADGRPVCKPLMLPVFIVGGVSGFCASVLRGSAGSGISFGARDQLSSQ